MKKVFLILSLFILLSCNTESKFYLKYGNCNYYGYKVNYGKYELLLKEDHKWIKAVKEGSLSLGEYESLHQGQLSLLYIEELLKKNKHSH